MNKDNKIITKGYNWLVMSFPFMVLFSPRLSLMSTHARIDELFLFVWLPVALIHFSLPVFSRTRHITAAYYLTFGSLFVLFVSGLLYGDSVTRWSGTNLREVIRPLMVIMNIIVLRYWIYKAKVQTKPVLISLVASITIAGLIGLFAMFNGDLAQFLIKTYSPDILESDRPWSFDMSIRAMSVFSGYDAASMMYAMGILVSLVLLLQRNKRGFSTSFFTIITIFALLISIISSARVGFIATVAGSLVLLSAMARRRIFRRLFVFFTVSAVLFYSLFSFANYMLPENETIQRFSEIGSAAALLMSDSSAIESQSLEQLKYDQIYGVEYPKGTDLFFGFGDNGQFISDVGYVQIIVKYGLFGLGILLSSLFVLLKKGIDMGKLISNYKNVTENVSINYLMPALIIMFAVGGIKGGLYFITFKIGECFALIIALCIIEVELELQKNAIEAENLHHGEVLTN